MQMCVYISVTNGFRHGITWILKISANTAKIFVTVKKKFAILTRPTRDQ